MVYLAHPKLLNYQTTRRNCVHPLLLSGYTLHYYYGWVGLSTPSINKVSVVTGCKTLLPPWETSPCTFRLTSVSSPWSFRLNLGVCLPSSVCCRFSFPLFGHCYLHRFWSCPLSKYLFAQVNFLSCLS